ncbi:MAG: transcription elongation factor GreB [Xanthomonadales bacterium]|nr:transcription elongation factor GreB [Xanthomonadales bacterium]
MGRWRPPEKPGSPYITAEGASRLREEVQYLWRRLRPEVVKALAAAAAEGDRSENAEYTYRKKQLGGIDRRIRYLSKRIDIMQIVDRPPADTSVIRFGAQITLDTSSEGRVEYRIVGVDETDARKGFISIDSPVARALLGKSVGDSTEVELPECLVQFDVIAIQYPQAG